MSDQRRRIIDKIIGLKAMTTERGASEDEATAFAAKASKLMHDYAIEEGDLTSLGEHERFEGTIKYINPWRRDLIQACANSVFCDVVYSRGEDLFIIGRPLSIEVAWDMYWFIEAQVIQIGRDMYPGDLKAQRRFSAGAGQGVAEKLVKARQYDSDSLLPVVQEMDATKDAVKNMFGDSLQMMPARGHRQTREHLQGVLASDRIKLRKDIQE